MQATPTAPAAATRDYRAYVPPPTAAYAANMAAEVAAIASPICPDGERALPNPERPGADFDVVTHWRERAELFRKQGNHGSAQFCDTHAISLDAGLKRKKKAARPWKEIS